MSEIILQKDIPVSIEDQLDELKRTVSIAISASILFWWAGFTDSNELDIFGLSVKREYALFFAGLFYLYVNFSVISRFIKIKDLLILSGDNQFESNVSKLSTHSWAINPYANFGDSIVSRIDSKKGFGLLIVIWWMCNSSLYILADGSSSQIAFIFQGVFLILGLYSILLDSRIDQLIIKKLEGINKQKSEKLKNDLGLKFFLSILGITIGVLVSGITLYLNLLI